MLVVKSKAKFLASELQNAGQKLATANQKYDVLWGAFRYTRHQLD